MRKFSIDHNLRPTGSEFHADPIPKVVKHGDEGDEEYDEGSISLNADSFDSYSHQNHIQGYPSIPRIFCKGNDVRDAYMRASKKSLPKVLGIIRDYIGVCLRGLCRPPPLLQCSKAWVEEKQGASYNISNNSDKSGKKDDIKRPAPLTGGCRIEGFVRVKKVPGNLVISARSGAHSFDASQMNISHVIYHLSFGKKITPRAMSEIKQLTPYLGASIDCLNGREYITNKDVATANVTIEHSLQVVKTEVMSGKSGWEHKLVEEYEYTAHSSLVLSVNIPAAKFHFELSPMQVLVKETPKSFSHFITNVAGILDSVLHNTIRLVKKS